MTRKTSIDVYHQIESEGLLSKRRLEVYRVLAFYGPLTQMEVCRKINNPHVQDRSYMPRFAELKKMEAIEEIGERKCKVTSRNVLLWDTTKKLPKKLDKEVKMTRRELEEKYDKLRQTMIGIWKDKRTPDFIRDLIRENYKQGDKNVESNGKKTASL